MTQLLSPGLFIVEEQPGLVLPAQSPTATTAIAVVTERGPTEATFTTSKDEWVRLYGSITADAQLGPLFVDRFFNAGGRELWTKRVLHYTDHDDPATQTGEVASVELETAEAAASPARVNGTNAGPWVVPSGTTLVASVGGEANQTATFTHAPASKTSGNGGTYNIPDESTLVIPINGENQAFEFDASYFDDNTAAAAWEVAAFLNQTITDAKVIVDGDATTGDLVLETDGSGTGFSIGEVTGTAATLFDWAAGTQEGTGNVANGKVVTDAELEAITEAAFTSASGVAYSLHDTDKPRLSSVATGPTATLQIKDTSTGATIFGFATTLQAGGTGDPAATLTVEGKWIGTYANALTIKITAPTSGNYGEFNLIVLEGAIVREIWANLLIGSANELEPNYIEALINGLNGNPGSNLISVTDLLLGAADSTPEVGLYALAGGDDGLDDLSDTDFIGAEPSASGLRGFDAVTGIRMLAIPEGATPAVHQAMLTYAEVTRGGTMIAVLDPPANYTGQQIKTYVEVTAALKEASEFGVIYWPRLKIQNPRKDIFGNVATVVVPPSGIICGVIARNDVTGDGGVYKTPAGVERGILTGCVGFETDEVNKKPIRDLVFPARINPLFVEPGYPRIIGGPLMLKGSGNFPTIAERRGVIAIEDLLNRGLKFVVNADIDDALIARAHRTAFKIAEAEMKRGAFASQNPATAFKIDTGPGVNTPETRLAGQVYVRIGLATKKPALFVILLISQDTQALDAALAGAS